MKNLVFGLIATIIMHSNSFAQSKVDLLDIKGVELAIILDMKTDKTFKEFFVFQYNENDFSKIKSSSTISLLETTEDKVSIICDNEIITFTINNDYANKNDKIYFGYGLSHRKGVFKLLNFNNPTTLMDVVSVNGIQSNKLNCHSGGKGSTECSTESAIGGSCSVKCGNGYYSCCDDTRNECRCQPIKIKKSIE
jgi:hypothetical protein